MYLCNTVTNNRVNLINTINARLFYLNNFLQIALHLDKNFNTLSLLTNVSVLDLYMPVNIIDIFRNADAN